MELVETLYNKVLEKPLKIQGIFNEFFREEFVDMQGFKTLTEVKDYFSKEVVELTEFTLKNYVGTDGFILVHFPRVTITNENNDSVDITELYVKVKITIDGMMTGKFLLNRSEYSLLHLANNYLHSHIHSIPTWNFTEFQSPCTGSGPINRTIASLNARFDEILWNLFCLELSRYVEVESLYGGPYHRMAHLRADNSYEYAYPCTAMSWVNARMRDNFTGKTLAMFIDYYIKNNELPFTYNKGCYSIGCDNIKLALSISKCFTEWYNNMYSRDIITKPFRALESDDVVVTLILSNNKFYTNNIVSARANASSYEGQLMCKFKGRDVRIHITGDNANDLHEIVLLHPSIVSYIITKILNTINCNYGKERTISSQERRYL